MADIAGVALAVIPICVTVVEKYHKVAKLVKRFRKYDEQVGYISQAINIHKSIYKNALQILLESILSEDEVHHLLTTPEQRLCSDPQLELELNDRLGDSKDSFVDAISAIKDKLSILENLGRDCQSQVTEVKV